LLDDVFDGMIYCWETTTMDTTTNGTLGVIWGVGRVGREEGLCEEFEVTNNNVNSEVMFV
jgi:hypothetical protein